MQQKVNQWACVEARELGSMEQQGAWSQLSHRGGVSVSEAGGGWWLEG